jgi:hypothetical protein
MGAVCRARGAFGNVATISTDEPLPFAADMQDGKLTGAERRPFNRKAALFVLPEPVSLQPHCRSSLYPASIGPCPETTPLFDFKGRGEA